MKKVIKSTAFAVMISAFVFTSCENEDKLPEVSNLSVDNIINMNNLGNRTLVTDENILLQTFGQIVPLREEITGCLNLIQNIVSELLEWFYEFRKFSVFRCHHVPGVIKIVMVPPPLIEIDHKITV